MPSYFGREMTDAEYEAQIAADELALAHERSSDPIERVLLHEEAKERGVGPELWDDTVARAQRYLSA